MQLVVKRDHHRLEGHGQTQEQSVEHQVPPGKLEPRDAVSREAREDDHADDRGDGDDDRVDDVIAEPALDPGIRDIVEVDRAGQREGVLHHVLGRTQGGEPHLQDGIDCDKGKEDEDDLLACAEQEPALCR